MQPLVGEHKDIRFAKPVAAEDLVTSALMVQKDITIIDGAEGSMPSARTSDAGLFLLFLETPGAIGPADAPPTHEQEQAIWQLCSLLFDPIEAVVAQYNMQLAPELAKTYSQRVKLDMFKSFWAEQAAPYVEDRLRRAKSAEEKALLLLTKNDVAGACETLVGIKDFRLAALVAQLPSSQTTRDVMKTQIEAWKKRRDWSEMSDAVRALYCVLAGELREDTGNAGTLEDKASEFNISDRFNLMWQQSLGLRVFFGGHESIEEVISAYCVDLEADPRSSHPTPFWVQEMEHMNYESEDTLMGLLRLYAKAPSDPQEIFDPRLVSGSDANGRLAWQLANLLVAKKLVHLPTDTLERLSLTFATQLEAADALVESAWVTLHLPNPSSRQLAIDQLLQRNAGHISDPISDDAENTTFDRLRSETHLPPSTLFAAKALYAKATGDPAAQVSWLLHAGHTNQAHAVLCTAVAPQAVIAQDYDTLAALVVKFPARKPAGWARGGGVYAEFVRLLGMPAAQRYGGPGEQALRVLKKGLEGFEGAKGKGLEERVAGLEIRAFVREVEREMGVEGNTNEGVLVASGYGGFGAGMLERYRGALGGIT